METSSTRGRLMGGRTLWLALPAAVLVFVGASSPWPGFEHVHLELQRGRDINDIADPLPRIVGCFDEMKRYPADGLVLTHPVKC